MPQYFMTDFSAALYDRNHANFHINIVSNIILFYSKKKRKKEEWQQPYIW